MASPLLARAVFAACAIALLTALSACTQAPQPPMRVAMDGWLGNEMLAVADHEGHVDPAILRRVEFSSNQEILRALRNGVIESAALMLDEALVAVHDGSDVVVVAALDASLGGDAVIGRLPMRTTADLAARRVGVQLNSTGLQMLYRALAAAGLSIGDVTVVNLPPDRHQRAFENGEIDAVVTFDPVRTRLMARGGVDLYNSAAIAGDIVNVLVVRDDYLTRNAARVRTLVDAWFAGQARFASSADVRQWVAHRQGLTVPQLDHALSRIELFDAARSAARLSGERSPLLATARRFHFFMRENGRLQRDIAVERLFRRVGAAAP